MPTNSVVQFAVFAAGAALGATAAALAQRRNDRFTLPVTPAGSTSAISKNTEISRTPVVEFSSTGNLGLARLQGVGSEVLKHGVPGESLHPFMSRSKSIAWTEPAFFFNLSSIACQIAIFVKLCESRV